MKQAKKGQGGVFLEDNLLNESIIKATKQYEKHHRQLRAHLVHDSIARDQFRILARNDLPDRSFDNTTLACINQPLHDR